MEMRLVRFLLTSHILQLHLALPKLLFLTLPQNLSGKYRLR